MAFLPISKKEMKEYSWETVDFALITADAYVDHPSFGVAIISRLLESKGYKVGILAQPDLKNINSFKIFNKPRLAFLITSGNLDSMVNNYSVSGKRRKKDVYSPNGKAGLRPDRALTVYAQKAKEAYPDVPILLGGLEASLRRFAHYDYWSNEVKQSVLIDANADLLVYGMGERQILRIAELLDKGATIKNIKDIDGTCYIEDDLNNIKGEYIKLNSYDEIKSDKLKYAKSFKTQYLNQNAYFGKKLAQQHNGAFLVQNKPQTPLNEKELDAIYSLKFERKPHPIYEKMGGIPAIEEVQFSITLNRGCIGSCNFCSLVFHQGRYVTSRSKQSVVNEAKSMTYDDDFKGYIHDVGGPTANFTEAKCNQSEHGCNVRNCLFPNACKNLNVSHRKYLDILRELRRIDGVKKVFVRSGIRYDYLLLDKDKTFLNELIEHHISGQLKIAPEHCAPNVLKLMGKPEIDVYHKFTKVYGEINKKLSKEQYIVPYLMSSHPGSTLKDAVKLAEFLRDANITPEQVQDFYPTPGTVSTCMFYTELDPFTLKSVYVPKTEKEKSMQRALLQYKNPKNYYLVVEALKLANREDLIGSTPNCLIKPYKTGGIHDGNKNIRRESVGSKNKGRAKGRGGRLKKDGEKSKTSGGNRRK